MQKISTAQVDLQLFNAIHGLAKKSRMLDFFAVFFASVLPSVLVVSLVLVSMTTMRWEMLFISTIAALFARLCANEGIYFFYKRRRPFEALQIETLAREPHYPSFPSAHTSAFFALSLSLLPYDMLLGIIFLIASSLVGFFRIFCGLHWPSDILGGGGVGFVSFLIVYFVKINIFL